MRTPTGRLDYSKFALHSDCPGFHNKHIYTGSFTISGTITGGLNIKQYPITLLEPPSFLDVLFQGGVNDPYADPVPASAYRRLSGVHVNSTAFEQYFDISYSVSGLSLIFTATNIWQTLSTETLTPAIVNYRIVDYLYT